MQKQMKPFFIERFRDETNVGYEKRCKCDWKNIIESVFGQMYPYEFGSKDDENFFEECIKQQKEPICFCPP